MCRLCAGTSLAAFALGLPRHCKHIEVQFFVELRQFALHGHSEQLRRHGGQDAVVTHRVVAHGTHKFGGHQGGLAGGDEEVFETGKQRLAAGVLQVQARADTRAER